VSESATPKEEVDIPIKVLPPVPKRSEEEATEVKPVPPYLTPIEEVATITPEEFVERGPETAPESVSPVKVGDAEVRMSWMVLMDTFDPPTWYPKEPEVTDKEVPTDIEDVATLCRAPDPAP
jgi:hypothetical protein